VSDGESFTHALTAFHFTVFLEWLGTSELAARLFAYVIWAPGTVPSSLAGKALTAFRLDRSSGVAKDGPSHEQIASKYHCQSPEVQVSTHISSFFSYVCSAPARSGLSFTS
jgi:hypothetical protein